MRSPQRFGRWCAAANRDGSPWRRCPGLGTGIFMFDLRREQEWLTLKDKGICGEGLLPGLDDRSKGQGGSWDAAHLPF